MLVLVVPQLVVLALVYIQILKVLYTLVGQQERLGRAAE
jgi:hypothetical protein